MEHSSHFDIEVGERPSPASRPSSLSLGALWRAARRQRWIVGATSLIGVSLGLIYYEIAPPKFTATTTILVTTRPNVQMGQDGEPVDPTMEALDTDSQVEVISSAAVAKKVLDLLSPADTAALQASLRQSLSAKLLGNFSKDASAPPSDPQSHEPAKLNTTDLTRNLEVKRTGRTSLISIAFRSRDAHLSATIANTFSEAFGAVLRDRRLESAQDKLNWLEQRVEAARQASARADNDLRSFRASTATGDTDAAMRELQQKAENNRKGYQALLRKLQDALDEQSYPQSEFRVISAAEAPENQSSPLLLYSAGVTLLVGAAIGMAIGGLREFKDRSFRSGADVEELLSVEFVGYLPYIHGSSRPAAPRASASQAKSKVSKTSDKQLLAKLIGPRLSALDTYSTDYADSRFAETLRAIRVKAVAMKARHGSRIIALVSTLPEEGKSLSSLNLARMLAAEGARTLLVDVDFRKRSLSRNLAPQATKGLGELLRDRSDDLVLEDFMVRDETSNLQFLPVLDDNLAQLVKANDLASRLEATLAKLRKEFDFIVFDLPPVAAVADARPFVNFVDACFLVIAWGRTNKTAVRRLLEAERDLRSHVVGAVLNKVNLDALPLYESAEQHHYHLYYAKYFSEKKRSAKN